LKKEEACMSKFLEIVGDKPMHSVKQQDIREFFQVVQRLPSQRGGPKRPQGMSLRDWAGDDVAMSPDTFKNNYIGPVRHILTWARSTYHDQGFPIGLTVDAIEYQGTRERGEDKQRALSSSELQRLFLGDEMQAIAADPAKASHYWLPLLGLHTGARINELCQINPETDWIKQEGIDCLSITTDTEPGEDVTKSIKTGTSRVVPIHPKLIELGFLRYLEETKKGGAGRLFPAFKPKMGRAGERAREWFSGFISATGLRVETPFAKLTGFHAFRHTLITYAANHDDPNMESAIDQITGHVGQGSSVKRGYISHRAIKRAYETVCKVDFGLCFTLPCA
jgi:integrase